jgi:hypothetical protein
VLLAWGLNTSGQTTVPGTASGVTAIAAGASHNLACKGDGSPILQVDTYPLTIYSAAAVQELHRQNQALQKQVSEQELRLRKLEAILVQLPPRRCWPTIGRCKWCPFPIRFPSLAKSLLLPPEGGNPISTFRQSILALAALRGKALARQRSKTVKTKP